LVIEAVIRAKRTTHFRCCWIAVLDSERRSLESGIAVEMAFSRGM
jgi:hypothetical protein